MAHFSSLSFRRHTCPKRSTLPTSVLALQPTGWFLLTFFFVFVFDIPDDRVQRHGPPSWRFRMSLLCSPQTVYSRPPPSTWSLNLFACAYVSLTTIGPACATAWRLPNRGEKCFRFTSLSFGIYHRRFRPPPLVQAAEPSDIVPSGVLGVCFSSLYHH